MGDNFPVSLISRLSEERLARFRALCDEDCARHPGKIWGNKLTTEQFAGLEEHNALNGVCVNMIERFLSAMESYRVIFIIRHGASCIEFESPAHRPASYTGNPQMVLQCTPP